VISTYEHISGSVCCACFLFLYFHCYWRSTANSFILQLIEVILAVFCNESTGTEAGYSIFLTAWNRISVFAFDFVVLFCEVRCAFVIGGVVELRRRIYLILMI